MATSSRLVGFDVLRSALMLLGVAYHAAYAYVPGIAPYYFVEDPSTHPAFATIAGLLHAFRMPAYFALAGFFAHRAWVRRGTTAFVRDRLLRLGVPFLVALPVVWALELWVRRAARSLGVMGEGYPLADGVVFRPLHLWFLMTLMGLSLGALIIAPLLRARWVAHAARWAADRPWASVLALGLLNGLALHLLGEPRPADSFAPDGSGLAASTPYFFAGWLLAAPNHPWVPLKRWAPALLTLTVVGGLALFSSPLQWQTAGELMAGLVAWAGTLGCFGLALRLSAGGNASAHVDSAVDAAYWVYLTHYPLVLATQLAMTQVRGPAWLKYSVVCIASLGLSWLTWLGVRKTELGRLLGSRR